MIISLLLKPWIRINNTVNEVRKTILVLLVVSLVIVSSFVLLVIYNAGNLKLTVAGIETSYSQGILFPTLTIRLTVSIANNGLFSVTLYHGKIQLRINGINVGSLPLEEDWYILQPTSPVPFEMTARQFSLTYVISGIDAESLHSTNSYQIMITLRGESECMFYRTLIETSHQEQINMVPS